jgi:hypothetical protein
MRPNPPRPSGTHAPDEVELDGGVVVPAKALAEAISDVFLATPRPELEAYGDALRPWCVHDITWLLTWAVQDTQLGTVDLLHELDWLTGLLGARGYPLASLAAALDVAAEHVEALGDDWAEATAARLAVGAERVLEHAAEQRG